VIEQPRCRLARTGKGAGQIDFAFPFEFGNAARTYPFKGYVQLFSGYGETLIDYNGVKRRSESVW
jgi:outer membrane phospholipase A